MILFGHPTGAPFSHNAALSHFTAGRLEAFCVPWMPTTRELRLLRAIPQLAALVARLERRRFLPLEKAPLIQGRLGEWSRMARRVAFGGRFASEALSYEANDWLMRTMRREASRPSVTAVHAYEDCSLWQFEEAKRHGKACLYDLPIGYYPAWQETQARLGREFAEWLPTEGSVHSRYVRPEQKRRELELADVVLVPCNFVKKTVAAHAEKNVVIAPYGVDADFWTPPPTPRADGPLRFIYAGQSSLRKGIPLLIEAWKRAAIKDGELELVGAWRLADSKLRELPSGVTVTGPLPSSALRERYRSGDVFVFPSYFEGFGLVILEAMACGLPVIATDATAGPDVIGEHAGRIVPAGKLEPLVEALRWFASNRDRIAAMSQAAREAALSCTWERYRRRVQEATSVY